MKSFAAAALLPVLAGAAQADVARFEGDWAAGDPAACVSHSYGDTPNAHLTIRDGVLHGVESRCQLTNPVAVRDMSGVLFDSVCSDGGMEDSHRLLLMIDYDGRLITVRDSFAFIYPRCTGYGPEPDWANPSRPVPDTPVPETK